LVRGIHYIRTHFIQELSSMKNFLFYTSLAGVSLFAIAAILKSRRDSGADLLDLNSATERKLSRLPGISADLIERILENRPYLTKIDLVGRRIIPDEAYARIKHSITVSHAA
jgi:DNA uptake protein ComE-like DNA-binding protein